MSKVFPLKTEIRVPTIAISILHCIRSSGKHNRTKEKITRIEKEETKLCIDLCYDLM